MRRRPFLLVPLILLVLAGCGDDADPGPGASGGDPIFGTLDSACPSLTLANEPDDEARARDGAACFIDVVDTGTPIVWDVVVPTVEGDPIYHRFDFSGDDVVIVIDARADTFGTGSVRTERCASIEMTDAGWLPAGIDCTATDHPGFPEAVQG